MFNRLKDKLNSTKEKVAGATNVLTTNASNKLSEFKVSGSDATSELYAEYLGKIKDLYQKEVEPKIKGTDEDTDLIKDASEIIYEALPLPFRLVVSQEKFTEFVLENRDKLVNTEKETKEEK